MTMAMDTFAPLFSKIVDSSLWDEPDHICKIFITMLALKDGDGIVRYSAYGIARRARKTETEVLDALKVLSSPDLRRKEEQPHEGRRIQQVEDGWLILNSKYYQNMMRVVMRRWYQRTWHQNRRRKKLSQSTPTKESQRYEQQFKEGHIDEHGNPTPGTPP